MSALVLGDIVGQPGCRALFIGLKPLVKRYNADLVVVNGENAADGLGITPQIVSQLLSDGVDVITTGNHIWQKREIYPVLDENPRILRPANYPHCKVGRGHTVIEVKGTNVAVVNLQGRVRMSDIDCPFTVGKDLIRKLRDTNKIVIVDFHAEEPEEKEALAYWLNGMVTAVVGTHTHVQTADERILSGDRLHNRSRNDRSANERNRRRSGNRNPPIDDADAFENADIRYTGINPWRSSFD